MAASCCSHNPIFGPFSLFDKSSLINPLNSPLARPSPDGLQCLNLNPVADRSSASSLVKRDNRKGFLRTVSFTFFDELAMGWIQVKQFQPGCRYVHEARYG